MLNLWVTSTAKNILQAAWDALAPFFDTLTTRIRQFRTVQYEHARRLMAMANAIGCDPNDINLYQRAITDELADAEQSLTPDTESAPSTPPFEQTTKTIMRGIMHFYEAERINYRFLDMLCTTLQDQTRPDPAPDHTALTTPPIPDIASHADADADAETIPAPAPESARNTAHDVLPKMAKRKRSFSKSRP